MVGEVVTVVTGVVAPALEEDLIAAYRAQFQPDALPDGVVRSRLLRGPRGLWQIHTVWRDQAALDAMLSSPHQFPAPRVFRIARAEHSITAFEIVAEMAEERTNAIPHARHLASRADLPR